MARASSRGAWRSISCGDVLLSRCVTASTTLRASSGSKGWPDMTRCRAASASGGAASRYTSGNVSGRITIATRRLASRRLYALATGDVVCSFPIDRAVSKEARAKRRGSSLMFVSSSPSTLRAVFLGSYPNKLDICDDQSIGTRLVIAAGIRWNFHGDSDAESFEGSAG